MTRKSNQKATHKRRIAMVCDFFYPRLGGVENHIWNLSQELLRGGHKVIVITNSYGKNRTGVRYMTGSLKVYYCPITPLVDQSAMPTFLSTLPLLRYILIREGIEIVHAHQATSTLANESLVYASMLGIPSVYTDHSLFGFADVAGVILNRVLQTTLCTVDAAIGVSHACRDNLVLRARLLSNKNMMNRRVHVIPNALNPAQFTPKDDNHEKQQPLQRIKVVVVSRLVYRKGVDLLVRAIPIICRELENVDFIIGGDGSKMLDLQEMVERERLQDRVECLGAVPHDRVPHVLRRGHVFLNCSLTESFCIAILEAASAGLLVVSTNVGGVPEVLPPDMILLASPTVPDLVLNLKQAVVRQQNKKTAVDPWENHRRVARMYSWERVMKETVAVYDGIMTSKRFSLGERLACRYHALGGGIGGFFVVMLAAIVETWCCLVIWWQPESSIDVVPDLLNSIGKT